MENNFQNNNTNNNSIFENSALSTHRASTELQTVHNLICENNNSHVIISSVSSLCSFTRLLIWPEIVRSLRWSLCASFYFPHSFVSAIEHLSSLEIEPKMEDLFYYFLITSARVRVRACARACTRLLLRISCYKFIFEL